MEWIASGGCTAYAVIDDYLPTSRALEIAESFPADRSAFRRLASFRERKWTSNAFGNLPDALTDAAMTLQNSEAIELASELSGIKHLTPDPTCYAGGVSIMEPGDFLNPHIDNSHDSKRLSYRRLNLLYYCNPEWREGDGGELELWDRAVRNRTAIAPKFNRLVIMQTDHTSWHSVAAIRRGERRCVSSYLFTVASPAGFDYSHVTSFMGRPEQRALRAFSYADNAARQLARDLGARRATQSARAPSLLPATH